MNILWEDANNKTTHYNRGEDGWVESVVSPVGPTLDTTFNSLGYMTELNIIPEGQTNSVGRTYTMDRGSHGRINSTTYPDGLQDHNNFNSWGYLINRIDRAGRNYDFTYAYPTELIKSQTQYLEKNGTMIPVTTKFDYDEQFNTLDITEPRNRYVETYLFDIQSRIIAVTNIEGQVMSVEYGLQDMVKEINRFDGSKINVGYDKYARQNKMTIATDTSTDETYIIHNLDDTVACVSNLNSSVEYAYRLCNKLTNVVSSSIVQTESSYKYDNVGNPINTSLAVCSRVAPAREIYTTTNSYVYDAGNRLTNMTLTAWERQAPAWQMDLSYSYNPINGLASSWTNSASGIFCSYEYDIMDRPISLEWKASDGAVVKSYDYMYSSADMITNVVDEVGSIVKYEFDTLDRLTSEDDGDIITSYSYDLAGNRTMKCMKNMESSYTNNYTLGLGNRLSSWGTEESEKGEVRSEKKYEYNTAGCLTNMVSDIDGKELNLSWDERYQLTSVDSVTSNGVGGKVSYDYNVLGQRVSRKEITSSTTNIEYYVHDGVNIVADLDEDKELIRSYTYAPGYDNIISMTAYGDSETNTYFYIRNHNNSVVALVDENGSIAESYEYSAYGEVTVFDGNELEQSALGNRYTFQGREIDWSTGLYNFRARWYDAETGRWLSKDPIGINGGLNQYVFCGDNPVMFVDPTGNGYDLIGIAPDGSPIYGPERDWGSNYFDPYTGGSSGGKGLTPCPLDFNYDLSNIRDLFIGIMNVEGFFDPKVCPGMEVFVQYKDGGPFHLGAIIPTVGLTSSLIVAIPADVFAEVVIAPFRFSQPDLPYPTLLIYDGYKEAYMKLWNVSECDE
jgi:RHS repeat-associated protein